MIRELSATAQIGEILETSAQRPVFLFKHSTACGTSSAAWRDFQQWAANEPRAEFWRVLAIERRELSQYVEQRTGVRHESPQVLLFHNGKVVWQQSHWRITLQALRQALQATSAPES